MTEQNSASSQPDTGLRRMMTWVIIALIATLVFAAVVVEVTLRWFNR